MFHNTTNTENSVVEVDDATSPDEYMCRLITVPQFKNIHDTGSVFTTDDFTVVETRSELCPFRPKDSDHFITFSKANNGQYLLNFRTTDAEICTEKNGDDPKYDPEELVVSEESPAYNETTPIRADLQSIDHEIEAARTSVHGTENVNNTSIDTEAVFRKGFEAVETIKTENVSDDFEGAVTTGKQMSHESEVSARERDGARGQVEGSFDSAKHLCFKKRYDETATQSEAAMMKACKLVSTTETNEDGVECQLSTIIYWKRPAAEQVNTEACLKQSHQTHVKKPFMIPIDEPRRSDKQAAMKLDFEKPYYKSNVEKLDYSTVISRESASPISLLDVVTYTCDVCNRSFTNSSLLQSHKSIHTEYSVFPSVFPTYECEICSESFSKLSNLKTHGMIHTGEKPFQCALCDKRFTRASTLRCHNMLHTGERPHVCEVCNKSFSCLSNLRKHYRIHSSAISKTSEDLEKIRYKKLEMGITWIRKLIEIKQRNNPDVIVSIPTVVPNFTEHNF